MMIIIIIIIISILHRLAGDFSSPRALAATAAADRDPRDLAIPRTILDRANRRRQRAKSDTWHVCKRRRRSSALSSRRRRRVEYSA